MASRTIRNLIAVLLIAWVLVRAAADERPPASTGLTETLEKRLVQLDVAVEGDLTAIRAITAEDFAFYVGEHAVQGLIVDHLCLDVPTTTAVTRVEGATERLPPTPAPQASRPRATFVFFFDQTHLTLSGREFALVTARDLINRLVVEGSQASIVSSAKRLETFVAMTGDREKLLAGLEKLRTDPRHVESYAQTEQNRRRAPSANCQTMKAYAREEWMEARRSTERIGFTAGALAMLPAPKSLIYFGDTLRQKAGLHYLYGTCQQKTNPKSGTDNRLLGFDEVSGGAMVPSAAHEFEAVVLEALARGVHFFTIQAEGVTADAGTRVAEPEKYWDSLRHQQALDTLVLLAAQTGGEAFPSGASNDYIGERIEKLTSCRLLLSFPPGDLPRDQPLNVTLELHVPKVKIRTQGRIVVPSPASLERARLLSAFANPESSNDGSLRILLVPRGGDGKKWNASIQLRLRGSGIPDNSAELGASIVRRDTVQDQFSASIATRSGSRPMVLEKTLNIAPGAFSVVAVARDAKRSDIESTRIDAEWPNPAWSTAAIAPIAALQSESAAISKDGEFRSSGPLAREVDEPLDPAASVTLASVVCRGPNAGAPITVERWIEDGSRDEFDPMTITEAADPCIQIVDVVPAGRLRSGVVDYRVVARIGDEIVATERRTLRVASNAGGK